MSTKPTRFFGSLEKIIAIPFHDPTYNTYREITDLPAHIFQEMTHFFKVYKELEDKQTAVNEVLGADAAKKIIQSAIENYQKSYVK